MRGTVFIDWEQFVMACNACHGSWPAAGTLTSCAYCRRPYQVEYRDSAVVVEAEDQVVATDGDIVYVLKQGVLVVVHRRHYPGLGSW